MSAFEGLILPPVLFTIYLQIEEYGYQNVEKYTRAHKKENFLYCN